MIARILRTEVRQDTEPEEGRRRYEDAVLPAFRGQPGFRRLLALAPQEGGQFLSITLWETAEQAEAGAGSQAVHQAAAPLLAMTVSPPVIEIYDVVLDGRA